MKCFNCGRKDIKPSHMFDESICLDCKAEELKEDMKKHDA